MEIEALVAAPILPQGMRSPEYLQQIQVDGISG